MFLINFVEEQEKQRIEEKERKTEDKGDTGRDGGVSENKKKLKAEDVYSDDSGSDSDSGSDFSAEKHGAASKPSFPSSTKRQQSSSSSSSSDSDVSGTVFSVVTFLIDFTCIDLGGRQRCQSQKADLC